MSENNRSEENKKPNRSNAARSRDIKARAARRKQILRRRRIALGLIIAAVVVIIALIVCAATGVFSKGADCSTLTLKSNGKVVFEELTSFEEDYYSKRELKRYIKDTIREYNQTSDGSVRFKKLKVKKERAYAKYVFSDYETYGEFTGQTIFSGTVAEAMGSDYDFLDIFAKVEDKAKTKEASLEQVTKHNDYKVLIVRGNMNVRVPGEIIYVSDSCTEVVDDNQITIAQADGNDDATVITYIIYK